MRPRLRLAWWGLCLALTHLQAGAFVLHLETDCPLSAEGRVLWANWTLSFNKVPFICYDHDSQSYQPCGLGVFFPWNYSTVYLSDQLDRILGRQMEKAQQKCQGQVQSLWGRTGARQALPNVRISPITPQNTPAPIMLACDVWGFYPRDVGITWLWNGAPVKNRTVPEVAFSNGDWTYQAQLTLPVDPQLGGTYTCRVTHGSLKEAITKDWAPGLPLDLRVKVGVSVAVLGVGVLLLVLGTICWGKRVPEGYAPIDGSTYPEGH
ncbi:class II histocompatibility antigen, M beta 1 chain [Rhineura floridana]|uniref:class II histocompatibility antigen, M beta 1 chain n=1 Tax=Rhineura floridana TaxID=261503 RepID=UPI002AC80B63|nr:class II histocompatibility antigen, M beta 1 chain [Rhineura floridana]